MSAGYCIYDTYICIVDIKFNIKEGFDFYFHHLVSVLGAVGVMISGRFCIPVSAGNLVSEFSNAAMNLRWRFLKHKLYDHFLFTPICCVFMVCFLLSRGVFMLMLLIRNYEVQRWHFDVRTDHPLITSVAITNTVLQAMLYAL